MSYQIKTLVSLPILILALAACVSEPAPPLSSAQSFASNPFCATSGTSEPLTIPDRLTNTLDHQDGVAGDDIADALLEKAALEVAHAATTSEACLTTFSTGQTLFDKVLSLNQDNIRHRGGFSRESDPAIASIQQEITRMWREDQSARGAYISLKTKDRTGAEFWAQRLATAHTTRIDGTSTSYIESLLDDYDWIDKIRFGSSVSAHAWILIQHADDRPDLQARVLERMQPYLASGGIKPANYAYLWDRVAVNTDKKQLYGTQPTWECTVGKLELQPLEKPETVNQRRAELGMNTVEEGLEQMSQGVCR